MHLNGDSTSKIAEKTGISRTTQERIRNSRDSDGFKTPEKRTNERGRKPVIGFRTGRKIFKAVKENRSLTAAAIFRDKSLNHRNVSESTVKRYLNSVGLKARHKRKRVKMTPEHAKARLFFCKNVQKWKMKQWKSLVFSDECFVRPTKTGIEYCRKMDDEDWCNKEFIKEKNQYDMGVHIWAAISSEGLVGVEWLNSTPGKSVDSERYIEILKKFILEDENF